jgi:predicted esterase
MKKEIEFQDLERQYNDLWQEGDTEIALKKVKIAAEKFPEEDYTINLDLVALYLELEKYDKAEEILRDSFAEGYWYPEVYIKPIFENERFSDLAEQWKELKIRAGEEIEPEYIVRTPDQYKDSVKYPLFIALHGWGENAELFTNYWYSEELRKKYIVLYPQSTQIVGMKNYCWNDSELSKKEVYSIYQEILQNYNVDESQIIIGGFSQGAGLAMEMGFMQTNIPIKGFVSLCPPVTELYSEKEIKKGVNEDVRGVIITGDKDPSYQRQGEMVDLLRDNKLPVDYNVVKDLGHWFPEDLPKYIDNSLEFINK